MKPIRAVGDLQLLAGQIPRSSPAYATNLFLGAGAWEGWAAGGDVIGYVSGSALVLTRKDRDFRRVYHVSADWDDLRSGLALLPAGSYVADLIGPAAAQLPDAQAYAGAGFVQHSSLVRMTLASAASPTPPLSGDRSRADSQVCSASRADVPQIAAMLERLLDPYVEQIPAQPELAIAADESRLLCVRKRDELAGMLMFDRKGQTAHLRYWHVDAGARGEGIGGKLMEAFLDRCAEARRIILWVIGHNVRSISIYRHYGFAEDGLLDRIMILHKRD